MQEAFLRALSNEAFLQTLQLAQRRAWLYRTVKNLFVDSMRHASYETPLGEIPEEYRESEDYAGVEAALLLDMLPEEEKLLFVMRYLQGYNSRELSELFHMPPGTVRSKLSSARKHLRDALKEGQKGEDDV